LKKVCYKVSLCENCQRQSCKAFIGLTNRAKMIGGGGATTCIIFLVRYRLETIGTVQLYATVLTVETGKRMTGLLVSVPMLK